MATLTRPSPVSDTNQVDDEIVVRPPYLTDVESLAALFSEMQRHYRRPVTDDQAREAAQLACKPPAATFDPRVLLAINAGKVVGSVIMNVTFPAYELTQALYIRDLYVSAAARRLGVGRALVNAAARYTYADGFSALDWTTDAGNEAAQTMYEACGARLLSRVYYRLAREDMTG